MIFKKLWRAVRGHIDETDLNRRFILYTPSPDETPRYEDDDQEQRKQTQQHIDKANTVLYRFSQQQMLRRREY